MKTIKKVLVRNWRPKLICLLLATGIWLVMRSHIEDSNDGSDQDSTPSLSPF